MGKETRREEVAVFERRVGHDLSQVLLTPRPITFQRELFLLLRSVSHPILSQSFLLYQAQGKGHAISKKVGCSRISALSNRYSGQSLVLITI